MAVTVTQTLLPSAADRIYTPEEKTAWTARPCGPLLTNWPGMAELPAGNASNANRCCWSAGNR